MAIALVANTTASSPTGGADPAVTSAIDTTGATLLVIAVTNQTDTAATVTDNKGNTWTEITPRRGTSHYTSIWYSYNDSGSALTVGSGHTFSVTGGYVGITVSAWSGTETHTVDPKDQSTGATSTGTTTSLNTGSITPSVDGCLVFSTLGQYLVTNRTVNSPSTMLNQLNGVSGKSYGTDDAYVIQGTAASVSATYSYDSNSNGNGALIASFLPAGTTEWTYEQTFNSLTDGDLNTQDSWTGSTVFDVVTTGTPYEGAKHVASVLESDSNVTIDRTISGISKGLFYISVKINRSSGDRRGSVYLLSGTTVVARVFFWSNAGGAKIQMLTSEVSPWVDLSATMTNDTYYRVGIEFDDAAQDNKYRCNINNGAWSSWYSYNGTPSWTYINKIRLEDGGNNGSGAGTLYFDFISPNYTATTTNTTNFFHFIN